MCSRNCDNWLSIVPACACLSEDTRAYKATRPPLPSCRSSFMRLSLLEGPVLCLKALPRSALSPWPRLDVQAATLRHRHGSDNPRPSDWVQTDVARPDAEAPGQLLAAWPNSLGPACLTPTPFPGFLICPGPPLDEKPAELRDQTQMRQLWQDCLTSRTATPWRVRTRAVAVFLGGVRTRSLPG